MFDLTSAQGWAWYNYALENELTVLGPLAVRAEQGYIGQERDKILQAKQNGK